MTMLLDRIAKKWREVVGTKDGAALIDVSSPGFYEGREFRVFFDFSLTDGQTKVLKIVLPVNFGLHLQNFAVDQGDLLFEAAIQGSASAEETWTETLPLFGVNRTNERPEVSPGAYYTPVSTIKTGGTHTGGIVTERVRLKATNSPANRNTVGNTVNDNRLVPPDTYFLRFTGTGTLTTGIYTLRGEERPYAP